MWQILKSPQETIVRGKDPKGTSVKEVKAETIALQKQLASLKPKNNIPEFEHLRLMFDLRVQYLTFKEIENQIRIQSV